MTYTVNTDDKSITFFTEGDLNEQDQNLKIALKKFYEKKGYMILEETIGSVNLDLDNKHGITWTGTTGTWSPTTTTATTVTSPNPFLTMPGHIYSTADFDRNENK